MIRSRRRTRHPLDGPGLGDGFVPTRTLAQIPGLAMWWDSSSLSALADGDAVTTWTDSSGNGRDLSAATTRKPLYKTTTFASGVPVVKFDGTDDYMTASGFTIAQPNTTFLVARMSTDARFIYDANDASVRQRVGVTSGNWFAHAGSTLTGPANNKSLSVVAIQYNGASSLIRVDGVETTGTAGTSSSTGFTLGSQYSASPALYLQGEVKEILVYNRQLSAAEILLVERLLRSRLTFSPDMLGGMQGWWKADAITGLNDGDAVSSWVDSSGLGRALTQGTAANRPTYRTNVIAGKPVVRFDGSNDYLNASFGPVSQPGTLAVVAKVSTDAKFVTDGNSAANGWRIGVTGGNWFAGASSVITGPSNSYQFQQVVAVLNGASSKLRVDGTEVTGAAGSDLTDGLTLGSQRASSPAFYLAGDVAEVVMYNRALAAWEIALLEEYL